MLYTPCTLKVLPQEHWVAAAKTASTINPANGVSAAMLRAAFPKTDLQQDELALLTAKYWGPQGVRLTVGFLDNPPADLKTRILSHMNAWGNYCNVRFVITDTDPQVRIARKQGDGYWSYKGTDILQVAAGQPTMNLDSVTLSTSDADLCQIVRHETGHTIGFPHEHMRAGIVSRIDPAKAIPYFAQAAGWTADMVTSQILTPLDESALIATAQADVNSIMCYWLPGSIMVDGVAVPGGKDIDTSDAQFAATVYPGAAIPTSVWPDGKIYFFKGSKYARYDFETDHVDPGFPVAIAGRWPGFPSAFENGVDAAVLWPNGKVFFFKGPDFISYDISSDKTDPGYPLKIKDRWPGLWADGIGAVVLWPNGKAYFFKGSEYIRYDVALNKSDAGFPRPIAGSWTGFPESFDKDLDAAVMWPNGKAYFFKGSEYVRYDLGGDAVDPGFPVPIAGHWPGLWQDGIDG